MFIFRAFGSWFVGLKVFRDTISLPSTCYLQGSADPSLRGILPHGVQPQLKSFSLPRCLGSLDNGKAGLLLSGSHSGNVKFGN